MSCKSCHSSKHGRAHSRDGVCGCKRRRCPKLRRCKFKFAKWTCPPLCVDRNALTCCR